MTAPKSRRAPPPPPKRPAQQHKSALGRVVDTDTGWSFTGVNDGDCGFKLTDLAHDSFFLADSISIERIGLASIDEGYRSPDDQANYQVLSLPQMKCTLQPRLAEASTVKPSDLPLGYYMPRLKIEAEYEYTGAVYETDQTIRIRPRFVFTPYSKDPSHEPGGFLRAARFYPMLNFELDGQVRAKPSRTYRRVTAVQVLFRLEVSVVEGENLLNQAGVFYDLDAAGTPAGAVVSAMNPRPGSLFFLRAEKPLPYEIAGKGVDRGYSSDWDNIHQWATKLTPLDDIKSSFRAINLPPSPGLPFGFHTHWRWGETAATGAIKLPGGKQYAGPGGSGFPHIDPALPDQTIEFAIIKAGSRIDIENQVRNRIDKDPVMWLFKDFDKLWADIAPKPEGLLPSTSLVIWMSITAWHPDRAKVAPSYRQRPSLDPKRKDYELSAWKGTLYSHGLFFAHEDWSVLPTSLRMLPGLFSAQYLRGMPTQKWRRP